MTYLLSVIDFFKFCRQTYSRKRVGKHERELPPLIATEIAFVFIQLV